MIEIPLPAYNPWFDLTVILDNQAWSLEFQYNFLMGRFVFSVLSPDGNPVISGVPLEINIPLTFQYQNSSYELPDGDFFYCLESFGTADAADFSFDVDGIPLFGD